MKRELKFRVWDIKDSCWHNPNILEVFGDTLKALYSYSKEDEDNFIIQQYTGLKDKNDKEIYEGDILTNIFSGLKNEHFVVSFKSGQYIVENKNHGNFFMLIINYKLYEVVGNIFENLELLEK